MIPFLSRPARVEMSRLLRLAGPVIVTQVGIMLQGVVDNIMVGHVGVSALAGVTLGHVWLMGTLVVVMGIIFGIDPLVTQAHGARDERRLGLGLQRGLVVAAILTPVLAGLWLLTAPALRFLGQEPELCELAHTYALVQIPGIPIFLCFISLRQFLQGRGIVAPAMWITLGANVFNAAFNWALIYGHWGFPRLEVAGAGMATTLTRTVMLLALLVVIRQRHLLRGGWVPWSRDSFSWSGIREVFSYGIPVGVQLSLEIWAFEIATLFAGRLGQFELAAHTISLNLASLSFMMPLGIAMATTTRVGNLIGQGRPGRAQTTAWVAFGCGAGLMSLSALTFILLRYRLPAIYTVDPTVIALAASILPIAAAFQLVDSTQVIGSGILRGMGRTRPAAVFNLVGYYVLAIPLAAYLSLYGEWGLPGIWIGLSLGIASVAIMMLVWVARRGPGTLTPEVAPSVVRT